MSLLKFLSSFKCPTKLFGLAFASFLGLISIQPFFFSNADGQILDTGGISSEIENVTQKTAPENTSNTTIASTYRPSVNATAQAASYAPVTNSVEYSSYIAIGSRIIPIFQSDNTAIDAGSQVARYGSKFLYAHDTAGFNELASLPVGTTFSVTLDGSTTNYRITDKIILDYAETARYMRPIVNASYKNISADLAMMTCSGQYDTSLRTKDHRLIAFAVRF